jgi:hypothetical protein
VTAVLSLSWVAINFESFIATVFHRKRKEIFLDEGTSYILFICDSIDDAITIIDTPTTQKTIKLKFDPY